MDTERQTVGLQEREVQGRNAEIGPKRAKNWVSGRVWAEWSGSSRGRRDDRIVVLQKFCQPVIKMFSLAKSLGEINAADITPKLNGFPQRRA